MQQFSFTVPVTQHLFRKESSIKNKARMDDEALPYRNHAIALLSPTLKKGCDLAAHGAKT